MIKKVMLLVLACVFSSATESPFVPHTSAAKVGLVLIGFAQDGFALAADGSSLNTDGRVSQEQKLFPLGKQAAVALTGTVSIQDPIGKRVRGEVNVARITAAWTAAHQDADLQTANRELNLEITNALNAFLSTRDPGRARGAFQFGVIVAGFDNGKPVVITTKYFMPALKGKPARKAETSSPVKAKDLWIFGNSAAAMEVANGKIKFESAPGGAEAYLQLFSLILGQAESDSGKKLDGKRAIVAPPNRFATVKQDGFAWSKAEAK